jgi:membrane-bound lytic murein transglycosylase B
MSAMRVPTLNWTIGTKLAAGAIGALAVAGGATAAVTHFSASPTTSTSAPSVAASPAPSPSANAAKQKRQAAARAMSMALVQGEAQVLGLTPQQLNRDRRQGMTIQQLASQKGMSETDFQTKLSAAIKPILDGDVQQGTLTSDQEQRYLQRVSTTVPNWDQVAKKPAAPAAQPSPAGQGTTQQ